MGEIVTALVLAVVSIIGTAGAAVVSYIKLKQAKKELAGIKQIIEDSNQLFFVTCPTCGTKIYLNSVNINAEKKEG